MRAYSYDELLPELQAYLAWVRGLENSPRAKFGIGVSLWYRAKGLELYTRAGPAVINGELCPTLCLANIELTERRRGRGFFGHLVQFLQAEAPALGFESLKVEAVNNDRLLAWLLRHGFRPIGPNEQEFGPSVALELAPVEQT